MDNTVSEYSHVTSCITQNHSVIKHGYFKTKQKKKKNNFILLESHFLFVWN